MPRKAYLSADELLRDSFRLARRVLDSGWRPRVLVALWRGGTPVGVAVHEYLAFHGLDTRHMAVKCRSYASPGRRGPVRIEYADPAFDAIRAGERVLVVDDIFDSGRTAAAIQRRLAGRGAEVRLATVYWKPAAAAPARGPDYHVRVTRDWIVFPHELLGLTSAEVRRKPAGLAGLLHRAPAAAMGAASRAARLLLAAAALAAAALAGARPAAAAAPADDPPAPPPLRIVTSFYPMYVAALNVVHDAPGVEIHNLTTPCTGCPHDYRLTVADRVRLDAADVLIVNGAGMEPFLDRIAGQIPALRVIDASAGLPLLPGAGGVPNPHVWLGVSLHIAQISNIVAQLTRLDPPRAAHYRAGGARYTKVLERLRADLHAGLRDAPTRDVVTFHDAFAYFAREFGLRVVAIIERAHGAEPSARDLARTVEIVRRHRPAPIFADPQYSARAAATIARETGSRLHSLDAAVSGPMRSEAYVEIMRRNLDELRRALGVE